jgi:hypothetical protein
MGENARDGYSWEAVIIDYLMMAPLLGSRKSFRS